jgi:AcrR family transcriptional regulator
VFAEKGLEGASVDDLVKAAGFTRGAFYSNFATKEELFGAAFERATDELTRIVEETKVVTEDRPHGASSPQADDGGLVISIFEAVRPVGRDWCLLHSEAITQSLRSLAAREMLSEQRARLRTTIAGFLDEAMDHSTERMVISAEDLAQLLLSVFIDLLVREYVEQQEVTELAPVLILGTLHAFIQPCAVERSVAAFPTT